MLYRVSGYRYNADGYASYSTVDDLFFPSFRQAFDFAYDCCSDFPYAIYEVPNYKVVARSSYYEV